jgi:putative CRISPR-associated protein (TIGR02619 family)
MPRLVISTVGTSLLTNQLDGDFESGWSTRLQATANYSDKEVNYYEDVLAIIETLKDRAIQKLYSDPERKIINDDVDAIRGASAELNGIYGLYQEQLDQGNQDIHWLIATDTAQGRVTAEIVESFLKNQGLINASTYIPPELTTASSHSFSQGIAKLIPWMQDIILPYKNIQYQICFNLVGGFKALQGYFNTIGMFYADEIIYIFEGANEVITIPRLPIKVDQSQVEPYKVQLAMMGVAEILTFWEEARKVPNTWVLADGQEMTLSTWGQLIWNQCKDDLLSQKLLKFPKLDYQSSFLTDYQDKKEANEKIKLQEVLARVSCLLNKHKDGISALKKDGIIRLRKYEGKNKNIDHFDLPKGRRVSCITVNDTLQLRHYGEHDYVNNNP